MNVLVVHCHPEPQSFCSALASTTCEAFAEQGAEVRFVDLYGEDFNPIASSADFSKRVNPDYLVYALEQRNAAQNETMAPDIQRHLRNLLWCDLLVLNFPVFWFSVPAMLKGWIDRVFVSGVCYGGQRFYDRGGLRGRRALVCATLGGREHMFGTDRVHPPLNDLLLPLLRGSLAYVGMDVYEPLYAYHVPYISGEARGQVVQDHRLAIAALPSRPVLSMPSLSAFDEKMRPLMKVGA